MRKFIMMVLFLVISYAPSYGSSIIAVRNDNEVVIGTDSKRLTAAKEDLSDAQPELACKIVRADNVFVASAGIVGILPSNHGEIPAEFDLAKIMNDAALSEGSIMDKADNLAKAVEDSLLRMSEWAKKKMRPLFEGLFIGKQLLQVVMAGMENGSPAIIVMAFELSTSPSGELRANVESRACPGIACPTGFVYIFMGKHEAIDKYLPLDPEIWKSDPVEVVQKLMEIEVTSERETVGPPIDILRITKDGPEWIQEKEMCEDLSQSNRTSDHYVPIISPEILESR